MYIVAMHDMSEQARYSVGLRMSMLEDEKMKMQALFEQTAAALANAIDAKDQYTRGHSSRVAEYSVEIAKRAGKTEEECKEIYFAALLHDVGKIGVRNSIINKAGRLTNEEFEEIRKHPEIGRRILSSISQSPYLSIGANYHHERYDGRGYPEGLKGDDIPEIARIIAVADSYDAMTSKRSYRDPVPQEKVREELLKGMGTQFDPQFAKIMLQLIDQNTEYKMKDGQ
ncbi:MAG: HD-GYP domain-containing protein [Lachnospiraceae bacterium]|nr:HD-GYP domain-containing protein [Lachnospiraceae bacterium]